MRAECRGKLIRLVTGELYYSCHADDILRPHMSSVIDCPVCQRRINAEIERDIPTRVINVKQINYHGDWITVN